MASKDLGAQENYFKTYSGFSGQPMKRSQQQCDFSSKVQSELKSQHFGSAGLFFKDSFGHPDKRFDIKANVKAAAGSSATGSGHGGSPLSWKIHMTASELSYKHGHSRAQSGEFAEASVDPRDAVLVSKGGIKTAAAAASTLMSTPLVIEQEDNKRGGGGAWWRGIILGVHRWTASFPFGFSERS